MEGRTIARPYVNPAACGVPASDRLQWRAGQLPGHTGRDAPERPRRGRCFNGGPDNCPAILYVLGALLLEVPSELQWRAGQLPGHTPPRGAAPSPPHFASMEGRTIARPYQRRQRVVEDPVEASMEGRTIARPYRARHCRAGADARASMEGRTIARPYLADFGRALSERGGASMEGRTIARPYMEIAVGVVEQRKLLQWRAGQLPGHTEIDLAGAVAHAALQWRAGQLPGHTGGEQGDDEGCCGASMEGRTIARPYAARPSSTSTPGGPLQWRAGQLPGHTWWSLGW